MKRTALSILAAALIAAAAGSSQAGEDKSQPARPERLYSLSREEVNLVRVPGEMIEHAVYDTDALEVSPDKARGVLYVRVIPAYAASGKKRTAAFVSTGKSSYALAFSIDPVGAQEITVEPSKSDLIRRSEEQAAEQNSGIASIAAMPMAPLPAPDFVAELKSLVKSAAAADPDSPKRPVGAVFSEGERETIRTLAFPARKGRFARLAVTQSEMRVSDKRLVDILTVQNMTAQPVALDWKRFARATTGVLAVAAAEERLAPGAAARLLIIRDKSEAAKAGSVKPALDELLAN
jgi:hypothetical protein